MTRPSTQVQAPQRTSVAMAVAFTSGLHAA